jgi:hypothetical protein
MGDTLDRHKFMAKRERHFSKIEGFREDFRNLSIEELKHILEDGCLDKQGAAALRQVLAQKEEVSAIDAVSEWWRVVQSQRHTCERIGADFLAAPPELKVGVSLGSLLHEPLNALRHVPAGATTGWYIWGGERLSFDPQFFQTLHVADLAEHCVRILPYLGLAPGWRVLVAEAYEDVWFDAAIVIE